MATPIAALLAAFPAQSASLAPGTAVSRLSDERQVTYWTDAMRLATIRQAPNPTSRGVARLRWFTEDGYPEVYVVLRQSVHPRLGRWLQIRVPARPNGRTGWIRRRDVGPLRLVRTRLIIDRHRLRATLYRRGRVIWTAPIGVGARSTPTPPGRFWIRERLRAGGGIYGPWAFGTSAYSSLSDWPGGGVIGIHGTNQPSLIPGRPSHGCIRVRNPAVRRLARLMPVGTPVLIV
jgi:lipoprotein-anchoring transpeptidase ErfK/SrfK